MCVARGGGRYWVSVTQPADNNGVRFRYFLHNELVACAFRGHAGMGGVLLFVFVCFVQTVIQCFVRLSVRRYVRPSVHPSVGMPIRLSIRPSLGTSIRRYAPNRGTWSQYMQASKKAGVAALSLWSWKSAKVFTVFLFLLAECKLYCRCDLQTSAHFRSGKNRIDTSRCTRSVWVFP